MDGTNYVAAAALRTFNAPIICFSPVRWAEADRLRLLMRGIARDRDVFFLEEAVEAEAASLRIVPCPVTGVQVVTPMLPRQVVKDDGVDDRRAALDLLLARTGAAIAWYAGAEAPAYSRHVAWLATLHDDAGEASRTTPLDRAAAAAPGAQILPLTPA
ncbi:hypothetical protein [Roseococcus pinisoli]|uniref:Uncharacterized protein n=1 Tax=Roseococcus pinisoli TaxID=2835040 RepID=A0ABS5QAV3_9PROT|nr:hypothetical protein [Roseococcus pinisoli]MBS7810371.1 hypothetical protein [Roseococcus pinisoli]